jgi:RHS repeat-associated protein
MRMKSLGSRKGIGRSSVPVRCLTESLLGSRFVTYKINAMGQRVQKVGAGLYAPSATATIDATTGNSPLSRSIAFNARFVYDEQGRIIGEYANDGKLIAETIWFNDLPIATLRPKGSNNQIPLGTPGTTATQANNVGNNTTANKVNVDIYYVHPDHLGTPRVVTRSAAIGAATTGPNAINKQVWRANTDPFGSALGNSAPNENPQLVTGTATQIQAATFRLNHRFPGQSFDAESGKSQNYFRDYDPSVGRYATSDPIGLRGGLSAYGYVGQSPIIGTDTFGLYGCKPVGFGLWECDFRGPPIIPGLPIRPPQDPGKSIPIPPPEQTLCAILPAACTFVMLSNAICKEGPKIDCKKEEAICGPICVRQCVGAKKDDSLGCWRDCMRNSCLSRDCAPNF